jgi:hypothetical protein
MLVFRLDILIKLFPTSASQRLCGEAPLTLVFNDGIVASFLMVRIS